MQNKRRGMYIRAVFVYVAWVEYNETREAIFIQRLTLPMSVVIYRDKTILTAIQFPRYLTAILYTYMLLLRCLWIKQYVITSQSIVYCTASARK